jgi:hypothetical protein
MVGMENWYSNSGIEKVGQTSLWLPAGSHGPLSGFAQ